MEGSAVQVWDKGEVLFLHVLTASFIALGFLKCISVTYLTHVDYNLKSWKPFSC